MTKDRVLLKLILDEIDLGELKLDKFSKRLNLQKRIYLLQLTGLDLRYRYNWYLRGPYCPSLTQDAFLLKEEISAEEKEYEEYELSDFAKDKILKAKGVWDIPSGVDIRPDEWVELLASLHYLKHIAYWTGNKVNKERIISKLIEAKPQFTKKVDLIEEAWRKLDEAGLVNNKTLN